MLSASGFKDRMRMLGMIFGFSILGSTMASTQAVIKVNDTVNVRFGFVLQTQADWTQDRVTDNYQQNLFVRRMLLFFGGQVAKDVSFFFDIGNPNIGKTIDGVKNTGGWTTVDGYVEWRLAGELLLDAGIIVVPLSHNSIQGVGNMLPIDLGAYSFLSSAPTRSFVGRDAGFQARGLFLDKRLEYRIGAFSGARDSGSVNAFRTAGRLQYNFFDTETGFFTAGTYLGRKHIFSIGAGFDFQKEYRAFAIDSYFDQPLGSGALTAQVDLFHYEGGGTLTTLPEQNDYLIEAGYYLSDVQLMPWVKFEGQTFVGAANESKDQTRFQVGISCYVEAYNFNIKAGYGKISPKVGKEQNLFTVQVQMFYF